MIEDDRTWSYDELLELVHRLAYSIAALGVEHPRVVINLGQGAHACASMLATLFAGGTYCPLNVTHPAARRARMVAMFEPHVVITGSVFAAGLELRDDTTLIDCDRPLARHTLANPAPPGDLAYVMFTSGSTGDPKGVMIGRDSLSHYVQWLRDAMSPTPEDRWSQHPSIAFDLSALDIYGALGSGAALVPLVSTTARTDPALVIRDQRLTIWNSVPSVMDVLIRAHRLTAEMFASLRLMSFCGEPLLEHHLRAIFDARPDLIVHNTYGPTETTVSCTLARFERPVPTSTPVTIGRPIANAPMYIVDEELRQLPTGVAGEIYIGGVQVARGYLNRSDLTAQSFVADPFVAGGRLYKTGDRARWLADGTIEFLGRADFQVKLRGYRIELGEFEATLSQVDGVQRVVVVMREDVPGDKRLVAYYAGEHAPDARTLRRHAERDLPEYMVPSAFVLLTELPLTSNGKIDRNALPAPDHGRAALDRPYVAPRTAVETQLAAVWSEVLGVAEVGVDDNFFALGGHSVLAVELISMIRRDLRAELWLAELFETPTIAQTATRLRVSARRRRSAGEAPVAHRGTDRDPAGLLPCSSRGHARDGRPVGHSQALALSRTARAGGDRARGVDARRAARDPAHDVREGRRQPPARSCIRRKRTSCLRTTTRSMSRHDEDDKDRRLRQTIGEFLTPMDLGDGPVVRFKLIRLAPDDHALLVLIHHIVYDGAASALLFRELADGYRAAVDDPAADLSNVGGALPFQFLDVAAYLASYIDSPAGRADREYWTTRLAGVPPLELPVDFSRDEVDAERAVKRALTGKQYVTHFPQAELSHVADPILGDLVVAAARRANVPLLVYFLAGLAELLHHDTGQTDLVLQTSLDVRPLLGAALLVGGFNSPVLIRVDLSKHPSREELLLQVRDTLSQAYEHALVSPNELVPAYAGRVNFGFFLAGSELQIGDAIGTPIPSPETAVTPFDLRPAIILDGPQLTVSFGYNTRLFRRETIVRLCERFVTVLRSMADDPHANMRA